jgi:signal transduction histidine kinase
MSSAIQSSVGSVSIADSAIALKPIPHSVDCKHEVQFYFDDRFLVRSLVDYVRSALDSGGSAIVVATRAHREELAKEMERSSIDLSALIDQGRFVSLDATDTLAQFMVNGSPDEVQFREVIGPIISSAACSARNDQRRVVIFGEMVALLWQDGDSASVLRLEQLWNELAEIHSFRLRCGYPLASFDRQVHTELFARICGEHHVVIPAEGYTELSDESERLLAIARLQQTEQVLKTESVECRLAQAQKLQIENQNQQLIEEIRNREAAQDELRRFTRRLLAARDEEQRRIAAELHENTAQLLAALSLYFGVLHEEKGSLNPRLASVIASSRSVSDNLLREIRKLSHLLHPPTLDDVGLSSALREYVDQVRASTKARIELEISEDLGRFNRKLEIAVFRIVEEALKRVRSGSGDLLAIVRLTRSSMALQIEIQNQQNGTSQAEPSSRVDTRIMGIHERALEHGGSVQFTSDPTGTLLRVTLPLPDRTSVHS